ncbi:MAG TPA: sigma-70 family RNA polymerase sigma factor [Terriglobales bacterium]|nr:sigma-70 family RNA polymerase sigma factor [Terriglobales bacterium]
MVVRAPASRRSPAQANERLLVEAAQKDPACFGDLYELHFELVYAFVARRVGNRDAAEDLTSEVFHKALANLQHFEWRGVPFGAWLLKIAANAITDRAKRGGRELSFESPPEVSEKPRMEQAQDLARLFRLVDELPRDQRNVVVMRFAEEKSTREVAQQLGRSEGAVQQLQLRGLRTLRTWLEDEKSEAQRTQKRGVSPARKSGAKHG